MTIALLNINSLLQYSDEIRMLNELGIHILALNETEIEETIDGLVNIEGYTIKRCDRSRNRGGVAVYLEDTLFDKCTVRKDLPKST